MKNTVLHTKTTFSKSLNWILYIKNYEIQRKRCLSSTYNNLYHYAGNNPVKYTDPDGNDIVTFTIVRNSESRGSYKDINLRQKDTIHFKNETTGKTFTLTGCQTVVSNFKDGNPKTPAGNTIRSNEKFSMQYLKSDASKYKGPVFNVQNANTDGLGMIDDNGVDVLDKSDKRPFRLHSNILKNSDKLPMASDGCPMYPGEQIDAFDEFLQESNIKPGDVLQGFIKEDINYGP